jgi:peroxiredoxin
VLGPGDPVPDVTVFAADCTPVNLAMLAADGPYLLSFYPFDWTET